MSSEGPGDPLELDVTLRDFAAGQKLFNRYTLIKTLGRGGMGVVWLARDDELERDIALKFLPDLIIHDRAVLGDLKRETRRSLELTHKNIIRIYDFVHDQTSGCISMEYVDGDTLSHLRADKPRKIFEPDELTAWTSQLCDALDYAHNHARIVHRDLKPANLMVNQRGDLKVADFGIARSLSDSVSKLTMQHRSSGTLVYMSPQQLDGERGTQLDDVYSVGASIYELLTSTPPFYSGNVDRQIREKVPPPMARRRKELEIEGEPIDPAWEEVVASCLAKNPAKRPQSVSEIAKRLEMPTPKPARARRAAGKSNKRVRLLIATGALIGVAAIGGWYFWNRLPTRDRQSHLSLAVPARPAEPEPTVSLKPDEAPQVATPATVPPRAAEPEQSVPLKPDEAPQAAAPATVPPRAAEPEQSVPLKPDEAPQAAAPATVPPRAAEPEPTVSVKPAEAPQVAAPATSPTVSMSIAPVAATPAPPITVAEFKPLQNAVYKGTIHVKDESSVNVPLAITFGSDRKSGTMIQSGRRGDVVVKFTGVWDGQILHAVTQEVVSVPKGINWEPEAFTLRFTEDGKSAAYECPAESKTYFAELSAQSTPVAKATSIYKGIIHTQGETGSRTPLIINLAADRKSGTMTQSSKSGDTVVRFTGIWDGDILRAVTNEVVSKPKNIQWKPESFTLRFDEDGKRGTYECNSEGRLYTAELYSP